MNKTQAINLCLRGIGVAPIATADEADVNLDAAFALQSLEQASHDIQAKGWWFNREANWKLTPGTDGRIKVPNGTLDISAWNASRSASLALRGGYLYDRYTHGTDMREYAEKNGYVECVLIMLIDFDDLPPVAQNAIAYRARRLYGQDVEGDKSKYVMNTTDEEQAYAILTSAETRNRKDNAFQNPTAQNLLGMIGGQNAGLRLGNTGLFPRKDEVS